MTRIETIRVQLPTGQIVTYDADIAGLGIHLATGGKIVSLHTAQEQARTFFATERDEMWTALIFWAILDDAPIAYRIEISRTGTWKVFAASPMPGAGEYPADGIWRS